VRCQKLQQAFKVQSFGLDAGPQSCCHSFTGLSIIRCAKSAQKFAVRVCEVATVVMETTQLVVSRFKNFFIASIENWIKSVCYIYNGQPRKGNIWSIERRHCQ